MARVEKSDAKRMYCEEGLLVPEISKRLTVPEKTVYRWKEEEGWDRDREAMKMTSFSAYKQALKIAIDKLTSIALSGQIDVKEADALTKIIKSAKSLYKDVDVLGNVLLGMSEFSDFLQDRSPETLEKLLPWISEFGQAMSKKYGKRSAQ